MTVRMGRVAAAALAMLFATGAAAGPVADKAAQAEALISSDPVAAISAMDAADDAFWDALPFGFASAGFADAGGAFHSGDEVKINIEPYGYGFAQATGGFEVAFGSAVEIRMGDIVLGETEDLGTITWSGATQSHAVHVALNLALPELKPGDYTLLVTLTDKATQESATATLPFTIAE